VHTGVVHTVTATAANAADVTEVANLLHGEETTVYGDAGYTGAAKRVDGADAMAWHIAEKRSVVAALVEGPYKEAVQAYEHLKARVRARVEHPFRVIKRRFGYRMVRYKGLLLSRIKCNTFGEFVDGFAHGFGRCFPSEHFSGAAVEQLGNVVESGLAYRGQIRALGQELPDQPVGVFVAAALPGAYGSANQISSFSRLASSA